MKDQTPAAAEVGNGTGSFGLEQAGMAGLTAEVVPGVAPGPFDPSNQKVGFGPTLDCRYWNMGPNAD